MPYDVILTTKKALFKHFKHYNMKITPKNHDGDWLKHSGYYFLEWISLKLPPFRPYSVILTPKTAIFKHFEQIFADFCFLLNHKSKLPRKTMMEIVYTTQDIVLKQIFPILTLSCHLDPKNSTFWTFWAVFANFGLLLNYQCPYYNSMDITPIKLGSKLFIILNSIFWNNFFPNLFPFWLYDVILNPQNSTLIILSKSLQISAFYSIIT